MIRQQFVGVHGAIKLSMFAIITHPTITTYPPRLAFCLLTLSFKLRLNCFYASFASSLAIEQGSIKSI